MSREGKQCPNCGGVVFGDQQQFHVHLWDCRGYSHQRCDPKECKEAAWQKALERRDWEGEAERNKRLVDHLAAQLVPIVEGKS